MGAEWQPSNDVSDLRMRVAEPGTLAYLERVFNAKAMEEYGQLSEALEAATGKRKKEIKTQIAQSFPEGYRCQQGRCSPAGRAI